MENARVSSETDIMYNKVSLNDSRFQTFDLMLSLPNRIESYAAFGNSDI